MHAEPIHMDEQEFLQHQLQVMKNKQALETLLRNVNTTKKGDTHGDAH